MFYKSGNDLNSCKVNKLKFTFTEIANSKKVIPIIVRCLYKYPVMDVADFNKNLNPLFDKLTKEKKQLFLLGNFNINLLNYNNHQPTNEFLDSLALNSFRPYIQQPTRLTSHSKTLIYNIFSNVISLELILVT